MAEVTYVKYNRTRRERFQIKTAILEEEGQRYVEKSALWDNGIAHIRSFEEKYNRLSRECEKIHFLEPHISADGSAARFDYLRGQTMAEILGQKIGSFDFLQELKGCLETIYAVRPEYVSEFEVTPEFLKVFCSDGEEYLDQISGIKDDSFDASNVDGLFENMLVTDHGFCAIDYEWVYTFPVPAHFMQYRTLFYFYRQYKSLMEYDSFESFIRNFEIEEALIPVYEAMEHSFQNYVHGENQRIYLSDYIIQPKSMKDLAYVDDDLIRAKERIGQLKAELSEKDTAMKKIQEVQRLTNNHVANLESLIANLRHEVGEMGKTLTYLNGHEALIYKIRRKLGRELDRHYPQGTVQRKKLQYAKNTVLHPAKYLNMYMTVTGKNLIKGDFEIGEDYLKLGKLIFPKEENPRVSIVIPVYNQIHYTYLCLASILEHTKDVSYEIIIADDVSKDATEHLNEFVENIVICRNSENQGFLKNCNNAAKSANGRYVMFLNNDTQVTAGWLSSLVELIESDSSIGMVGSKLVYPDGRLQEAGGILWSDGSGWNYGRLDDPDKAEYNYVKDVDYISGAAILLSNDLWKAIGGFDERFAPAYCEDSDLAFEVRKQGYRVVYQPLSKVIHFEGISNGTDVNGTGLKRYQVENSQKLKEKWAEEFAKQCENTGNPNPFLARERSQGKQIILVVDHYVPTFDKDAGSKTTFQYLKMFLKKGYVVKFLGDNFLHEEPYSTVLQQMGIEILYGADYVAGIWEWFDKNGPYINIAYLNRPHIATKYVDYIKEHTDMKVIFYGHDLHFLREFREYELTGDTQKKQDSDYWKSIEFTLMRKSAVSYYPSNVEVDAIHAQDEEIPVKAITAYVYEDFLESLNRDFEKREGLLFVGGFAHPPNADAVLWFAREVFPLIREKMPVNFYIVGSKVTEEIKALEQDGSGIIVKGFVSEEELSSLYRTCKIVVVPLRYGAGVKGKVVEAIYNGAPIVTTSVGSEGIPGVEEVLLVEDKPRDFADAVVNLYYDNEKLAELSEKTQDYIREYFSIDAVWNVVREDFEVVKKIGN